MAGDVSTPSTASSTIPSISPRQSHTGAIVGGVLGGIAALSGIGLLLGFLYRKKKQKHENVATVAVMDTHEEELVEKTEVSSEADGHSTQSLENSSASSSVSSHTP